VQTTYAISQGSWRDHVVEPSLSRRGQRHHEIHLTRKDSLAGLLDSALKAAIEKQLVFMPELYCTVTFRITRVKDNLTMRRLSTIPRSCRVRMDHFVSSSARQAELSRETVT